MIVKTADTLRRLTERILLAVGADEENAAIVADHLVAANLCGVDTHGLWHLPVYVADIRAGDVVSTAKPTVLRETPTTALVSGNWGFGQVVARFGMELALQKAAAQNVAVVSLVQVNHVGRLGEYVEMAAAAGMIGMVWAGGLSEEEPSSAPYGGRTRVLNTNPVAMGFPAGQESPFFFDYATTAVAGAKVVTAIQRGTPLPPGAIADKDGVPSTNPQDFMAGGAHLPFGAHKGYALMLAVEWLGRLFAGADLYADQARGGPYFRHQGVTLMALRADTFQPFAEYAGRADEMERRLRAVPPAPGFREVLVPGDLEARARASREREGIPIADDTWQSIVDVAASLGVAIP